MLAKLENDDSETADQQRKMIQEQIMQLSSQIATLTEKKMREAQKRNRLKLSGDNPVLS